jgi:hypothetical protein
MSVELYWKRVIFSDETQVVVGRLLIVHQQRHRPSASNKNVDI